MADDPARYLASRVRAQTSDRPTAAELAAVCRERGAEVRIVPNLPRPGIYVGGSYPLILLRRLEELTTAHELCHHLARDNAAHGIDYLPPEWEPMNAEEAAHRFADALNEPED